MPSERRVVVTGVGPLASVGVGKAAFWEGILSKKLGLRLKELSVDGESWDSYYLHEIEKFDIGKYKIEKNILEDISAWKKGIEDKDLYYLLAAVKLAIDDSGISYDRDDNNIGLFLTSEHPGFESFCEKIVKETASYIRNHLSDIKFSGRNLFRHVYESLSLSGYDLQSFMYLYFVARTFGIHGYSIFSNNACASGLFAMESAARQIKYGGSEIVLLAGGDYAGTMFKHLWFKERGLYAEDGKMKPFSKNANGLVLGDGYSAMVLEELDHAMHRNAHIYGEYLGGGFFLEGWKVVLPRMGSTSYQETIKRVLKKVNLKPEDIDLINPHGVAIKVTDAYEAKAITDIFGNKSRRPFITSFKPYIGHNLGGSAILESIILLLSMEKNVIPPTLNCEDVEPKYNIELVNEFTVSSINKAMKLSCGFAGYNAAAVFIKLE